jgi:adenylyltransferase/sulfurtransferase
MQDRYSRQILFAGIGEQGQVGLLEGTAVVIGCGALGAVQIETLARAGVGRLRLVDRDVVEQSNLHRQILYTEQDAAEGIPNAVAAARRVRSINADVDVEGIVEDVRASNVERLVAGADVILDATDKFDTRFLINAAAVNHGIPWIYGAVVGAGGLSMTIRPRVTPCLRCVFEEMPAPGSGPTCDTAGVILPAVSVVASIQSTEAIKLLAGRTDLLHGGIVQADIWENRFTTVRLGGLRENGDCPTCQRDVFEFLADTAGQSAVTLCGRGAVQVTSRRAVRLDLPALAERLRSVGEVELKQFVVRFRVGDVEMTVFPDARSIIKGVADPAAARGLYARYVGA